MALVSCVSVRGGQAHIPSFYLSSELLIIYLAVVSLQWVLGILDIDEKSQVDESLESMCMLSIWNLFEQQYLCIVVVLALRTGGLMWPPMCRISCFLYCNWRQSLFLKPNAIWDHIMLLLIQYSRGGTRFWPCIWPFLANRVSAKFLAKFLDFVRRLCRFALLQCMVDYLQLNVMKLVLACHHLSDLVVWCSHRVTAYWTNMMTLHDYRVFVYKTVHLM